MHAHTHTHTHTYAHTHTHTHTHTHIHTHTHTHTHSPLLKDQLCRARPLPFWCRLSRTRTHLHALMRARMPTHTRLCSRTRTHNPHTRAWVHQKCKRMRMHVCMCVQLWRVWACYTNSQMLASTCTVQALAPLAASGPAATMQLLKAVCCFPQVLFTASMFRCIAACPCSRPGGCMRAYARGRVRACVCQESFSSYCSCGEMCKMA